MLLGVPLMVALAPLTGLGPADDTTVAAAAPDLSANVLDRPMIDLAVLPAADERSTPMLLTLGAEGPDPTVPRVSVLRRGDVWEPAAIVDIDLGIDGLDARWFVDLGEGRFALIATTPRSAPGTGSAVVVALELAERGDGVVLQETNRQEFGRAIEDAGAADVDGFGSPELVLGMRPLSDTSGSCGTSSIVVVDGAVSAIRRSIDLPGPLGAGVIGQFDGKLGDDLLVYASAGCPPGGTFESRLLTIRLADGTRSGAIDDIVAFDPTVLAPPLRLDLDGSAPDELIAMTDDGLSVFDPAARWRPTLVAGPGSVALVAGPTKDPKAPGARVGILDAAGTGALVTARVGRDESGAITWQDRSALQGSDLTAERWTLLTSTIQQAATRQTVSNAWLGDAVKVGCPDLMLPGAILPCGQDAVRSGAAWLATRPVAAMPIRGQRVVLVAAGLGWEPTTGLPPSPTPSAAGPPGWWRRGPSTPFAVSEIRARDLIYFREFPTPAATIETTTAKDGTTALPGFTGTRLFTSIAPLAEGEAAPDAAPTALDALTSGVDRSGRTVVARVAVPPGLESGRDGSFARLAIGDLRGVDGRPVSRWAMQVVPINDWGEWGAPVARAIARDAVGPTVAVEDPFTSPIWPFYADLAGRTEPGSAVVVEGMGDLGVDRRGRFAIRTQLAPWPQRFRVTATDPVGNATVGEFWVVGGIDYRRFPWPGIGAAALLLIVAARGLFGAGRGGRATSVQATRWSTGSLDLESAPEIEELPPGSGLARG